MTFAEKLRELRVTLGRISEAKLAEAAGIPFGTLHSYQLADRKPSFAAVIKIAKALGVSCEAFAECSDLVKDGPDNSADKARGKKPAPKNSRTNKPAAKKASGRRSGNG